MKRRELAKLIKKKKKKKKKKTQRNQLTPHHTCRKKTNTSIQQYVTVCKTAGLLPNTVDW